MSDAYVLEALPIGWGTRICPRPPSSKLMSDAYVLEALLISSGFAGPFMVTAQDDVNRLWEICL